MDAIVVSKLGQRQPVCPVILAMAHKNPEIGLDLLVYSLHLSVHLQVVCSGGVSWILRSAASSLEKLDTKALPLSLMMASGSPWCLQTCSRKRCATPAESTVVMVGMDNVMVELGVFWDIHTSPVHDQVSISLPLV